MGGVTKTLRILRINLPAATCDCEAADVPVDANGYRPGMQYALHGATACRVDACVALFITTNNNCAQFGFDLMRAVLLDAAEFGAEAKVMTLKESAAEAVLFGNGKRWWAVRD
jgi:hypothetical protein